MDIAGLQVGGKVKITKIEKDPNGFAATDEIHDDCTDKKTC